MTEQPIDGLEKSGDEAGDIELEMTTSSTEFYRQLIEFSADAIISMDEKASVELFNKAAENLFGYAREEVIGENIKMLMPEPYRGEHDGYVANYRNTGEAKILGKWREVEGQRKDGTTVPIEIGVREFEVEGKRLFTGIVRDLTQLKLAQQEIERRARDIEDLSTPVISVWRDVLVLPLIGTLDSKRILDSTEKALIRMSEEAARILILDITGVPIIDTMVANHLFTLTSSVRLMGGHSIVTGISPATAISMVNLGVDLSILNTRATLQDGLTLAIELLEGG